ncbi:MAG: glycosyltransferase family 39 protein [Vulcanimicrobiaceae bacterium]
MQDEGHASRAAPVRRNLYPIALALVFLLAAALRLYDINGVPSELIVDELDLYNSVHSIVQTGHDIDGRLLPFLYSPFTRNPPIYGIAAYASSLVFGTSPFGLRFPAVAFGLIAVALMYAIAMELTGRRDVALAAAALGATQPIFVHFSRVAWEPASELPFLLGGLYAMLRAFRPDRIRLAWLFAAALLLGLTSYTYMAGWFYAVALGGAILVLNAGRFRSVRAWLGLLGSVTLWAAVSAPALWMFFGDPATYGKTQRIGTFSQGVSWSALGIFAGNYLKHFAWSYLVATGDPIPGVTWRYLVGFGAFYWWVIPLTIFGLVWGSGYVRTRWGFLWLLTWLAVYPLGGALTNEGAPNAPRTLAGAPVFCILAALGVAVLLDVARSLRPRRIARVAEPVLVAVLAVNLALSVTLFSLSYFTQYVHAYSNAWDSGTHDLFAAIREHQDGYSRVCFSVWPAWYGLDTYVRFYLGDVRMTKVGNVADAACYLPGTLIATDAQHPIDRPGFTVISRVLDVSGSPFAFVEARPPTPLR